MSQTDDPGRSEPPLRPGPPAAASRTAAAGRPLRAAAARPAAPVRPAAVRRQPAYGQQPYAAPAPYGRPVRAAARLRPAARVPARSTASRPATASTAPPRCRPSRRTSSPPRSSASSSARSASSSSLFAIIGGARGHRCGGQRRRGDPGPRRARRRRGRGADRLRHARPGLDRGHDLGLGVGAHRPQPRACCWSAARSPWRSRSSGSSAASATTTAPAAASSSACSSCWQRSRSSSCCRCSPQRTFFAAHRARRGALTAPGRSTGVSGSISEISHAGCDAPYTPPPTRRHRRPAPGGSCPMSSPTPGSDPNYPQGGAPQGQPGWGAPQPPGQGYTPGAVVLRRARRLRRDRPATRHGHRRRHHRHRLGCPRPRCSGCSPLAVVFALGAAARAPGAACRSALSAALLWAASR